METEPMTREQTIDQLNALTERKWDLVDELGELEIARTALFERLRGDNGNL